MDADLYSDWEHGTVESSVAAAEQYDTLPHDALKVAIADTVEDVPVLDRSLSASRLGPIITPTSEDNVRKL